MKKTALVIGATGLIGKHLTQKLLKDGNFYNVKVFGRKDPGFTHPKLEYYIVNFEEINKWKDKLVGDVLFSCLGTTIKKAKSREAQYKVDYTFQFEAAKAASENKVGRYVLVSSIGANPASMIFYSRIKGELEEAVKKLDFDRIVILRPSLLTGKRGERRIGEEIGEKLFSLIQFIPALNKYRPISGDTVAEAMIKTMASENVNKVETIESQHIFKQAVG